MVKNTKATINGGFRYLLNGARDFIEIVPAPSGSPFCWPVLNRIGPSTAFSHAFLPFRRATRLRCSNYIPIPAPLQVSFTCYSGT